LPRVIITQNASQGIARCRGFISAKNPAAARRAGIAIEKQLVLLESNAELGRPFLEMLEFRELLIGFGDSGYVLLYRFEPQEDVVYVLAFRHQKEAGY
jgi:plasmid stabilization system protein ParE